MLAGRRRALAACLLACLVSLAAHGLLLSASWPPPPQPGGAARAALQVHTRADSMDATEPASRRPAGLEAAEPVSLADRLSPIALGALPPAPAAADLLPAASGDGESEGDYLPRPRLSVPPQPTAPVLLSWPDVQVQEGQVFRGGVTLYIDEAGVVRRIRFDDDGLPELFQAATRQAFLDTRYQPGQLQGRAVKSLIRIEIRFDAPRPIGSKGVR